MFLFLGKITLPVMDEFIAMRLSKGKNFSASYLSPFNSIISSGDDGRAKKIADTILNYISYDDLLLSSEYFKDSALFKQIVLSLFSNSLISESTDIYNLIEKYKLIKSSLAITDNSLLKELNKSKIEKSKLKINELDDEFINDCFHNDQLEISKSFVEEFNEEFHLLDEENYKSVFTSVDDIHFKFFEFLQVDSLTQSSLDVFKEQLLEKIEKGEADEKWWEILLKYESNNSKMSIVNTLKDIRDQFLNNQIELDLVTAKKILPIFIKYNILDSSSDNFRTVIKNGFLSDEEFIDILLGNKDFIKNLYQNTSPPQKEGFRNIINEKREDSSKLEELAKDIGIRRAKE